MQFVWDIRSSVETRIAKVTSQKSQPLRHEVIMKTMLYVVLLFLLIFIFTSPLLAQAPEWPWVYSAGGSSFDASKAVAVKQWQQLLYRQFQWFNQHWILYPHQCRWV